MMATSPRRDVDQSCAGGGRPRPDRQCHRVCGHRFLGWFAPPGGRTRAILSLGART